MTAPWPVVDEDVARFSAPQSPVPSTEWDFSQVDFADDDLVAVGADLEPGTLVHAYSSGLFPMPIGRGRLGWFSPVSRGIIPLDGFHVSESLRKSARKFTVRFDTRFTEVMTACGDKKREHGWINDEFIEAYTELHRLGWAHSCEVLVDDELVGGVYGVRIRRFFAGESMFHRAHRRVESGTGGSDRFAASRWLLVVRRAVVDTSPGVTRGHLGTPAALPRNAVRGSERREWATD